MKHSLRWIVSVGIVGEDEYGWLRLGLRIGFGFGFSIRVRELVG